MFPIICRLSLLLVLVTLPLAAERPAHAITFFECNSCFGDPVKAILDWWSRQPSPEEIRQRVPTLATKLAYLSGLNKSLADALLGGSADTAWMYQTLAETRDTVGRIFDLIKGIDPTFGEANNHLIADLSKRMDDKLRVFTGKDGRKLDLNDPQVKHELGAALQQEAAIMHGPSHQIASANSSRAN